MLAPRALGNADRRYALPTWNSTIRWPGQSTSRTDMGVVVGECEMDHGGAARAHLLATFLAERATSVSEGARRNGVGDAGAGVKKTPANGSTLTRWRGRAGLLTCTYIRGRTRLGGTGMALLPSVLRACGRPCRRGWEDKYSTYSDSGYNSDSTYGSWGKVGLPPARRRAGVPSGSPMERAFKSTTSRQAVARSSHEIRRKPATQCFQEPTNPRPGSLSAPLIVSNLIHD
ncbi:uncharacterized protein PG986_002564 [Apiospora aurea]|uniref:Uncharacterized protein n=1 Tax=Apiospora aurea TaxID=335848 RepID=A0ABR1QPQ0_9PEZI